MTTRRQVLALGGASALSAVLAGCSKASALDVISNKGDNRGYIAGNGTVQEYPKPGAPLVFRGRTERGDTFDTRDYAGRVLVVNTWYAACPPCRAEAPLLRRQSLKWADEGVQFIGVNVRDETPVALAFDREFRVPYPSIIDAANGAVQFALSKQVPPNAVPTTLVLDREHRVASRVLGRVMADSILSSLIETALTRPI